MGGENEGACRGGAYGVLGRVRGGGMMGRE